MEPILTGQVSHIPASPDAAISFCYVENGAAGHLAAAVALLTRPSTVTGKTFNVCNTEPFQGVIATWNQLIRTVHGEKATPLQPLPYAVAYLAACVSEGIYWFTAGRVPFPRAAFWQLTRSTLALATTAITLSTDSALGFDPPYDTAASFEDIKYKWVPPHARVKFARDPTTDVDWGHTHAAALAPTTPDPESLSVLDRLAGPNPTEWELGVTMAALLGGVATAVATAPTSWTTGQRVTSVILAAIDSPAAVQCATGQSKRWYHSGGQMANGTIAVILAEMVLQQLVFWWAFGDNSTGHGWVATAATSAVWFVMCGVAVAAAPLHIQRPMGTLLTLASIAVAQNGMIGPKPPPGTDWFPMVFSIKYLSSHLPRHEPYRA